MWMLDGSLSLKKAMMSHFISLRLTLFICTMGIIISHNSEEQRLDRKILTGLRRPQSHRWAESVL